MESDFSRFSPCRLEFFLTHAASVYLSAEPRGQSGYIGLVDHKHKDHDQRCHASQPYPPAQIEEPEKLFRQRGIGGLKFGHELFHLVLGGDIACYPDKTGEQEENKAQ